MTNSIVYNLWWFASYFNNYNSLLFLNCKLNTLNSILFCVLIIYKAVFVFYSTIIIKLQPLNIYTLLILYFLLTLYSLSMATQLDGMYIIEEV